MEVQPQLDDLVLVFIMSTGLELSGVLYVPIIAYMSLLQLLLVDNTQQRFDVWSHQYNDYMAQAHETGTSGQK